MTPLQHVFFTGPVPLHGRLMREIIRGHRLPAADGTLSEGWEPHLHHEWSCVVVEARVEGLVQTALVPLHSVRSMILAANVPLVAEPPGYPASNEAPEAARRGRARTKRLDFVRE